MDDRQNACITFKTQAILPVPLVIRNFVEKKLRNLLGRGEEACAIPKLFGFRSEAFQHGKVEVGHGGVVVDRQNQVASLLETLVFASSHKDG